LRKGDQFRAGAGFQSAEPAGELAGSTRARTCSEESPARRNSDHGYRDAGATNGRHTFPATVGTHEDGAELRCPAAVRRTAPATSTPSPSSGNNSAATVVGGPSVARPIPTSDRPSTGRQDRHNLELGPVGPAGQALLAAGRVRLDGDGDGDGDGDIGRTDADPAMVCGPGVSAVVRGRR